MMPTTSTNRTDTVMDAAAALASLVSNPASVSTSATSSITPPTAPEKLDTDADADRHAPVVNEEPLKSNDSDDLQEQDVDESVRSRIKNPKFPAKVRLHLTLHPQSSSCIYNIHLMHPRPDFQRTLTVDFLLFTKADESIDEQGI